MEIRFGFSRKSQTKQVAHNENGITHVIYCLAIRNPNLGYRTTRIYDGWKWWILLWVTLIDAISQSSLFYRQYQEKYSRKLIIAANWVHDAKKIAKNKRTHTFTNGKVRELSAKTYSKRIKINKHRYTENVLFIATNINNGLNVV